jgi:hypothetical protein
MSITDTIKQQAQNHNLRFTPDYSGRFMYGSVCIGVVGDNNDFLDFWADLDSQVRREIGHPSTDSMGLSTIWYWPQVEGYQDPEADEDDEDW